jgi:chloride channel protein, CIC family
LLGLALPQILHTGYGWVQLAMNKKILLGWPFWLVLILPLAKIVATSLSIGSGGSGGIFGPGMMIGGMLGALVWRIAYGLSTHVPPQPAPFIIVGMMSLFGGIAHAPLAVMIMVAEMTGNLSLLAPAMIAVAVSTALVGDNTIYGAQLRDRASSPFYRLQYRYPILSSLFVRDAMVRTDIQVVPDSSSSFLLVDQTLDVALEQLGERRATSAPVVENGKVVGILSIKDALKAYRQARTKTG